MPGSLRFPPQCASEKSMTGDYLIHWHPKQFLLRICCSKASRVWYNNGLQIPADDSIPYFQKPKSKAFVEQPRLRSESLWCFYDVIIIHEWKTLEFEFACFRLGLGTLLRRFWRDRNRRRDLHTIIVSYSTGFTTAYAQQEQLPTSNTTGASDYIHLKYIRDLRILVKLYMRIYESTRLVHSDLRIYRISIFLLDLIGSRILVLIQYQLTTLEDERQPPPPPLEKAWIIMWKYERHSLMLYFYSYKVIMLFSY